MNKYDDKTTGTENPSHPANEIEVFDEIEFTEEELLISVLQDELKTLRKEHESIKGILKQVVAMEAEQGIHFSCMGMADQEEKDYLHFRKCLEIKINRL